MGNIAVRQTPVEDLRAACDLLLLALAYPPDTDENWAKREQSWREMDSLSAWDGDRLIGHVGAYPIDTVVPGGEWLPTAGVTRVGVLPTDTRRGALSAMITQLLDNSRSGGAALASLRASETTIYGRFGFGIAGQCEHVEIDTRAAMPLRNAAAGTCRLVPASLAIETITPIYERVARRPGAVSRPEWMWQRYYEEFLDGSKAQHVVVFTSAAGVDEGFAHYGVEWEDNFERGSICVGEIFDVFGISPEVELALWSFILSVDLIVRWRAEERPCDDILRAAANDPRVVATRLRFDEQWLRILDVDRALGARRWSSADPVAIAVIDPQFTDNNGTWLIGTGEAVRTTATAQLQADISALSAAYLGSTSWWELCGSGAASELESGAVSRADAVFAVRPLAFCGSHF